MHLNTGMEGFVVPSGGTSAAAGRALVEHLGAKGIEAELLEDALEEARVTLVHVPADEALVLVHHTSDPPVREAVRRYQVAILEPHRPLIVSSGPLPADVAWIFAGPVGRAEGALRGISLDLAPQDALAGIDAARPVLEQLAGQPLDPSSGLAVLDAADALVLRLRHDPSGVPAHDDAVYPLYTLVALGLLCLEAARAVVGPIELGRIDYDGRWSEVASLYDVHGFPALRVPGGGAMALPRKLVRRWFEGRGESARELWDAWDAMRPEDGD
ncbi:MAG: hypothetical protein H6737_15180 [Alphaproteobacteria bacterium]|nr:hypothetical protein [Alphaproteobacteria bacterium]